MKKAILPISLGLAGLALTAGLMWWAFGGQREDVAIARAFLTSVAAEDYAEARTLMTQPLADQLSSAALAQQFGRIEPWDRLRFGQRSSQSFGEARQTELWGRGITLSGCESQLYIRIDSGLIDAYDVTPLCPAIDTDA